MMDSVTASIHDKFGWRGVHDRGWLSTAATLLMLNEDGLDTATDNQGNLVNSIGTFSVNGQLWAHIYLHRYR